MHVEKFFSFEDGAKTPIKAVYDAYLDYYGFNAVSVSEGDTMSQHKFTRWILKNYSNRIYEQVVRIGDRVARHPPC